jgi:virulence factor Mce-like protein
MITMRRTLGAAVVLLVLVAALLAWRSSVGGTTKVDALFDSTVGLYPGSEVQVLGVKVGKVTDVKPEGPVVRVSMQLERGQHVEADTAAVIVAPTLVSDRYVQLTKPDTGGARLKDGAVIPRDRTATPVEIDDLYTSLTDVATKLGPDGANSKGALSDLLDVASRNLAGNGTGINRTIDEFGRATSTLASSSDDLFATIANVKEFNDMLVANDQSVADVNRQFAAVTDYLADDREDLADAITNLGDALAIVDDFIGDNRQNIKTSVDNLLGPTQVLVKQKDSLEESVRLVPVVLQNFLRSYNAQNNTLDGRANLNEASIWSDSGLTRKSSSTAPPLLLPTGGDDR